MAALADLAAACPAYLPPFSLALADDLGLLLRAAGRKRGKPKIVRC